ncbi:MAG: carbon-nitrogen hydrolase family protein [Pseudomonadota bacterium]
MSEQPDMVKVAAVQAAPAFMDLKGSVEKTCDLISQAAADGCDLIGFPETWVPGYPWYIWLNPPALNMKHFGQYHANSLARDSEAFDEIARCARQHNILVSLGASEQDHGSLYIAQFLIDRNGQTLSARRKLKPTHVERTVYGDGDGSDLRVSETDIGRVGQLACWEHLQPLSRYALFSLHEQIHVGAWPSFSLYPEAYALGPNLNNAASQMYAAEGQCFVVAPCGVISQEMIDLMVENETHEALIQKGGGYARIFGPDGAPLGNPLAPDEEGLVTAEIDLGAITIAKCFADPVGHYSRPDATALLWNREPQQAARTMSPNADRADAGAPDLANEGDDEAPGAAA